MTCTIALLGRSPSAHRCVGSFSTSRPQLFETESPDDKKTEDAFHFIAYIPFRGTEGRLSLALSHRQSLDRSSLRTRRAERSKAPAMLLSVVSTSPSSGSDRSWCSSRGNRMDRCRSTDCPTTDAEVIDSDASLWTNNPSPSGTAKGKFTSV